MKPTASEAFNGSFSLSVIVATLAGWTVQEWAAFAALVYSLLLILDKLGILGPLKSFVVRSVSLVWRWMWSGIHGKGAK